ncbi:1,5-anhydro-D-fructose reductase-like [Uranotaenia lowii]|uniref:1,5-anhydro-D-fructose reductase-like n=1 Tax=Uranotaenia lowii TaxID=190385 RepID=UPI0024796596|nr:1,5-anhydro-D-fructose reductase-like [Uranotaenia lowii]
MVHLAPTVTLNNGCKIPALGLGTWSLRGDEGIRAVKTAIDEGFRHFDTACLYGNEKEVGQAVRDKIAEGVITREDVFVTSKLWNSHHDPENVEGALDRSLAMLGLDYIDLYLMHTPMSYKFSSWEPEDPEAATVPEFTAIDFVDTWRAMEKLLQTGKIKSIGVSNFNSEQVARIVNECTVAPVINQVECNPALNQRQLIEFCKNLNVAITAYSPLGRPNYYEKDPINEPKPALDDPLVLALSQKYDKTPGQIILRYLIHQGTIPIPMAADPELIRQNIEIFSFKLSDEDIQAMWSLNSGIRTSPLERCASHKYFPFGIEF